MAQAKVQVRRIYEKPTPGDGTRVLVDRIWPLLTATSQPEISEAAVLAELLRG